MWRKYLCFLEVLGNACEKAIWPQGVLTHRLRTNALELIFICMLMCVGGSLGWLNLKSKIARP